MSVDLKGNTNYVALRGLPTMVNGTQVPGPYVVPRTNLSAIDMNVANGISAEGDTLGITLADPLEVISNMHGIGLLNADTLATALSYSRSSRLDVAQLEDIEFIGSVPTVINSNGVTTVYGIPITTSGANKLQISYNGPLPAVSEEHGLWLITADVMSTAADVTEIGMSMGPTTPITGYSSVSVNPNVWTRLAFLLNTNSSLYDSSLAFYANYENATEEESFSFKNVSVVEVSDLEAKYQAELAGVIGTPDAYMFKPGNGISIKDSTISMSAEPATVKQVIDGSEDALVGNLELTGAVTAGKAVDVTNMPSVTAGTLVTGVSAMQDMIWSGTTSGNIGFYNAATKFPAYAYGLTYLMLADVTNNGISSVTITGTDAVNNSLPVVIPLGKTARVAMLFTTATTGYFHVESKSSFDLTFSKLRELEVTGCSEEAREYIASLANPDNTDDYYLVDQDSVNPWLPMIDMKQSPYTLVQPGLAYKLFANDGEIHILAVPAIKANTYGRAAYVELFVGSGANIKCQSPLRLADGHSLSDNTLNNCSVKFLDGIATLTVDSTESSYIVTTVEGTTSGTLAYGLDTSDASVVIFNSSVDTLTSTLSSVSPNKSKEVHGNGFDKTYITGNITSGEGTVSFGNVTFRTFSSTCSVDFIEDICIEDSYTNDNDLVLSDNITLVLNGTMSGDGNIDFGNHTTIDASKNTAGGVLIDYYMGLLSVSTGNTVTFKGHGGYETVIGSTTGHYLLADGSIANSIYTVNVTSGTTGTASSGSLYYGLTNNVGQYITFDRDTDGQTVSLPSSYTYARGSNVTIIGNGIQNTLLTKSDTSTDNRNSIRIQDSCAVSDLSIVGTGIWFNQNGTARVNNVKISGFTSTDLYGTGAVTAGSGNYPLMYITGSTFTQCHNNYAVVANLYSNNTIVSNCIFEDNKGIALRAKVASITDCIFNSNHQTIYFNNNVVTGSTITNTLFSGNTGFAISFATDAIAGYTIDISGSTFATVTDKINTRTNVNIKFSGINILNSTVSGAGKIVFADGAVLLSTDGTGAINLSGSTNYIDTGTNIEFDGITVKGYTNTSGGWRNVLYFSTKNATFKNCCFENNHSNSSGGVMYIGSGSTITISGSTFTGNDAQIFGNAIFVDGGGNLFLEDTLLNQSQTVAVRSSTITISGITISNQLSNPASGDSAKYSTLRILANSTNTFNNTSIQQDSFVASIGSYDETGTIFTVGGTATVNYVGGSTVLSGIGTYINANGTNDFSDPVHVTNSELSGDGSLAQALSNTEKYALIERGVTGAIGAATAVDGKQVVNEAGAPILGGTFSLTSATVDEATKTVAIQSGGTMSIVDIRGGKDSVIDLGGTNVNVPYSATASASGCVFTNGGGDSDGVGGAVRIRGGRKLVVNNCIISGNNASSRGGGIYNLGNLDISNSVIIGNRAPLGAGLDLSAATSATHISGSTIADNYNLANPPLKKDILLYGGHAMYIEGGCTMGVIDLGTSATLNIGGSNAFVNFVSGTSPNAIVNISSGAIIDITGSTNTTPIKPGGMITIYGGSYPTPGTTKILYSSGGGVHERDFDDVEIHATSIDSKGIIYGATIYAPTGVTVDHYVHYTPDGGTTDSSVIIYNADCPYVVPGGLMNCQGT